MPKNIIRFIEKLCGIHGIYAKCHVSRTFWPQSIEAFQDFQKFKRIPVLNLYKNWDNLIS